MRIILLAGALALAPAQSPQTVHQQFTAGDARTRVHILNDIAASRSRVPVTEVIALVREAERDDSADVRTSAMAAVAGRASVARWAGTMGPGVGPSPPGVPPPLPREPFPAEWKHDQQILRRDLYDDCVRLMRSDPDATVRRYAVIALVNMERPPGSDDTFPESFMSALAVVYRADQDDHLRAEVVKTFRLVPNNTTEIRDVLRRALIDPGKSARYEALMALDPPATGGHIKLSWPEAEEVLRPALTNPDAVLRLSAVQAIRAFGPAARGQLAALESIRDRDPDPSVRAVAESAIRAIRR
jgi:HEAT repeat protein